MIFKRCPSLSHADMPRWMMQWRWFFLMRDVDQSLMEHRV